MMILKSCLEEQLTGGQDLHSMSLDEVTEWQTTAWMEGSKNHIIASILVTHAHMQIVNCSESMRVDELLAWL